MVHTPSSGYVLSQSLYYNDSLLKYYYSVSVIPPNGGVFPVFEAHYFWNVYPKLDSEYKVILETAYIYRQKD